MRLRIPMLTLLSLAPLGVGASTLTWVTPTAFVDDTPAIGFLAQYELGCGNVAGNRTQFRRYFPFATTQPHVISIPEGAWYCALRVQADAAHGGLWSAWSNEVTTTVPPMPKSPTTLVIRTP
jgi:hypothetical protein